jgi:hypothetical protein
MGQDGQEGCQTRSMVAAQQRPGAASSACMGGGVERVNTRAIVSGGGCCGPVQAV